MRQWLTILFLCFAFLAQSQTANSFINATYYFPKKERSLPYQNIPPGTIELKDNLFIDMFPIDNFMYEEMLNSVLHFWNFEVHEIMKTLQSYGINKATAKAKFGNIPAEKNLYTTLLIPTEKKLTGSAISSSEYMQHPKFAHFPVLNFNIYQAVMYCKWRTDVVKLLWAINATSFEERKKFPLNFEYRLATKEEIEAATEKFGISEEPFVFEYVTHKFPKYQDPNHKNENRAIFIKNGFEELTLEAYHNILSEQTNTTEKLTIPLKKTVFRCVCEIKD